MKTLFLTTVMALSLSAGGAFAQPSQAQGGGATSPTSNPPGASDATRSGTGMTSGGAMSNPGMSGASGGMTGAPMANPSSQGNAGPGTVPSK